MIQSSTRVKKTNAYVASCPNCTRLKVSIKKSGVIVCAYCKTEYTYKFEDKK